MNRFWKKADTAGRDKDDMKQWLVDENVLAADLAQRRKKRKPARRQFLRHGRSREARVEDFPPVARPPEPSAKVSQSLESIQTRKVRGNG